MISSPGILLFKEEEMQIFLPSQDNYYHLWIDAFTIIHIHALGLGNTSTTVSIMIACSGGARSKFTTNTFSAFIQVCCYYYYYYYIQVTAFVLSRCL